MSNDTTPKPVHGKIQFATEEGFSCCGQRVFHDFTVSDTHQWRNGRLTLREGDVFHTREEQYQDLLNKFQSVINEDTEAYNEDYTDWEDDKVDCAVGLTTLTILPETFPGLPEYLQQNGWKIDADFVNPRTGNRILHMSKVWV